MMSKRSLHRLHDRQALGLVAVCCTVEAFRCYSYALRLPRVVRMPRLAKRANKALQGSKVLRDRRGRKARLVQQEVAVR